MLPQTLVGFYLSVFAAHRAGIIAYYITRAIYETTTYILPAFLAKFVVGALESKPLGELVLADVMTPLSLMAGWIILYIITDIMNHLTEALVYPRSKKTAHVKMYQYLIDKSMAFYKNHSAGYLQEQAKYVINGTWKLIYRYPIRALAIVMGILMNFGMLFRLDWIFGTIIAAALMLRILHGVRRMRGLATSYTNVSRQAAIVASRNIDILSNFLNLKIFGNRECDQKYIGDYFDPWVQAKTHSLYQQLHFFMLPMTVEYVALILIIFLMAHFYISGQMTLADVAFGISAFFSVRSCIVNLIWDLPDFMDDYFSADQAYKNLTHTSPKLCNVQSGRQTCTYNSQIAFNNVSFKYDDEWVLRDINLCIKKGERIGIVGPSGSGKTTLVNLLMHLYDVTDGNIEIDGTDIRRFSQSSLKKIISFVPQESILFNRTLADNISYGIGPVSRAAIVRAARAAQAHDFIMRTEHGYDTVVGDRGVKLSGGQRQRITIAHAILKNSPILLLDEATSALDSETEDKIQQSLAGLMQNRTTIAIAHRLSTLQQMDRIIVMDQGRIVEVGTHDDLLARRGLYHSLWSRQYSGFM
ncbi:ABC transporter ATP-binding protein [bacterium]|nr:ABC transporter ATP-binding protein [bacterium]